MRFVVNAVVEVSVVMVVSGDRQWSRWRLCDDDDKTLRKERKTNLRSYPEYFSWSPWERSFWNVESRSKIWSILQPPLNDVGGCSCVGSVGSFMTGLGQGVFVFLLFRRALSLFFCPRSFFPLYSAVVKKNRRGREKKIIKEGSWRVVLDG
jgi:hypothetical protein